MHININFCLNFVRKHNTTVFMIKSIKVQVLLDVNGELHVTALRLLCFIAPGISTLTYLLTYLLSIVIIHWPWSCRACRSQMSLFLLRFAIPWWINFPIVSSFLLRQKIDTFVCCRCQYDVGVMQLHALRTTESLIASLWCVSIEPIIAARHRVCCDEVGNFPTGKPFHAARLSVSFHRICIGKKLLTIYTLWVIKMCHFIMDHTFRVSWRTFTLLRHWK